jgi:hypothetical protein
MKGFLLIIFVIFSILISACGASQSSIQTSVSSTIAAYSISTPLFTDTPMVTATKTPTPTFTPTKTLYPSPTRTRMPTSTPKPELGSSENPIPYGFPLPLVRDKTQEYTITLTDVRRGDEAWQLLYNVNQFNEPAPEGMEWIGILIKIEYTKGPSGKVLELDRYFVNTVTKGSILEIPFYLGPEPEFDLKILPEGEGEGWIFGHVYVDDPAPMIVFAYSGGNPGFYMSLTP